MYKHIYDKNVCLNIINSYLFELENATINSLLPISIDDLIKSSDLCEFLIEFLGDIYICSGLDESYNENKLGENISSVMTFLSTLTNPIIKDTKSFDPLIDNIQQTLQLIRNNQSGDG